jgi:hypothetical protein
MRRAKRARSRALRACGLDRGFTAELIERAEGLKEHFLNGVIERLGRDAQPFQELRDGSRMTCVQRRPGSLIASHAARHQCLLRLLQACQCAHASLVSLEPLAATILRSQPRNFFQSSSATLSWLCPNQFSGTST